MTHSPNGGSPLGDPTGSLRTQDPLTKADDIIGLELEGNSAQSQPGCAEVEPQLQASEPSGLGGAFGEALGALRDIANDMPGVRAVHKRTAMRNLARAALAAAVKR